MWEEKKFGQQSKGLFQPKKEDCDEKVQSYQKKGREMGCC